MSKPTEKEFNIVIGNTKDLGIYGFADDMYRSKHKVDLERERQDLRNDFENFKLCCEWLSQCKTTKTTTIKSIGSYGLKELIEHHYNAYIPNGTLIAAVLFLGISYKRHSESQNISVGISKACPFYKSQADRFYIG
ncbi:hypothetical protein [uncultured Desulfobacter sp.]|uniref:hypothetical protein n=1 Tax=uncultured Desulfobacter sp. TaxID=240139 RepID=UPI0029F48C92|nr:hypothetical protein [uncultured Desulfobacter sp.]